MVESNGGIIKSQGPFGHDAVKKFGKFVVIGVVDMKVCSGSTEKIVCGRLGSENRININSFLVIQKSNDKRQY